MLYVFHGTDVAQAGTKARALIESLRAKRPDAAFDKMEADSWNPSVIQGHLGGQGLFSSKYIVFLDRVTENADAKEGLPELTEAMNESDNIFIVLEGKLNAELKRAVEKNASKVVECEVKADVAKKPEINVFALADAVGKKDAFRAWSVYRQAIEGGAEPEALIGMMFWKAKTIADKKLAKELIVLYHEGHRGRRDLELATERMLLTI
jgi:DNA polymerase III delta subunit